LGDWQEFARAVDEKFGVFDYRRSLQDLLLLKQMGSVEEYTKEFEALQFQVTMFNPGLNDMFFTTHFVNGLKEEIKGTVQSQIPYSVDIANMLARIQQQILDRTKFKPHKASSGKVQLSVHRNDSATTSSNSPCGKKDNREIIVGPITFAIYVVKRLMQTMLPSVPRGTNHKSMPLWSMIWVWI
jgi:hypothetical protein